MRSSFTILWIGVLACCLNAASTTAHTDTPESLCADLVDAPARIFDFADETVDMLLGRADGTLPGGPGLRNGDVIHLLLESTPVENGADRGAAAYVTVYVPDGALVAGVPAKVVRQLTDDVIKQPPLVAEHYTHPRTRYMQGLQPRV